jgi:dCTP deaminase
MILSDADIRQSVEKDELLIAPLDDPNLQIQPASVDLRLGMEFYEFDADAEIAIDPTNDINIKNYGEKVTIQPGETYDLPPGSFVLGTTYEEVGLPSDIAGVLIGRSSFGRLGIVPYTGAGFIDPGFKGELTLEFTNNGPFTVTLRPGKTRIVQMMLFRTSSVADSPYGHERGSKYQNQKGPAQSRLGEEQEIDDS